MSESFLNNGGGFCFHKAHSFVFASQGFDLWCEKQPSYINNLVPACLHSNGAWWRDKRRNTVGNQYVRSLDTHTPLHTVGQHIISFFFSKMCLQATTCAWASSKRKHWCQHLHPGWTSWHDVCVESDYIKVTHAWHILTALSTALFNLLVILSILLLYIQWNIL